MPFGIQTALWLGLLFLAILLAVLAWRGFEMKTITIVGSKFELKKPIAVQERRQKRLMGIPVAVILLLSLIAYHQDTTTSPPTATPTPTGSPTAMATNPPTSLSSTITPSPTVPQTATAGTMIITLIRQVEEVAVCTNVAVDLSSVELTFPGLNERYMLGDDDVFGKNQMSQAQAGECWCMKPHTGVTVLTDICHSDHVSTQTGAGNWRSASIELYYGRTFIGDCAAQVGHHEIYQCDFSIDN